MLPLAALASGCGNYTIVLRVADIINAPGDDGSRQRLDIDIVCLSKTDADRHPDVANGGMRSDAWFKARMGMGAAIGDLGRKVHALRLQEGEDYKKYGNDTVIGGPLSSVADKGDKELTVRVNHSGWASGQAAIVIYGRFHDGKRGLLATEPVVVRPPPAWNTKVVVSVERTRLTRVEAD
jgi:hypothetical protein